MLTLHFDGLFRAIRGYAEERCQVGFMCYGWLVADDDCMLAYGHGGFAGYRNANSIAAEYLGLVEGLDALLALAESGLEVQVYGDAKSVIEQMRGTAEINASSIRPLYRRASRLSARFSRIEWIWIPRRENYAADSLTRRALRQMRLDRVEYQDAIQEMSGSKKRKKSPASSRRSLLDLRIYQNGFSILHPRPN